MNYSTPVTDHEEVRDVQETSCCIVGGGPAGVMLGLLLARQGVPATLLESHKDFDRDFRGDTIHPSTLEVLDESGLADRLHEYPHSKIQHLRVITAQGTTELVDLRKLRTRFPYIMLLPQVRLLEFLAAEAARYRSFRLVMGANVQRLVEEDGAVRGVRYRGTDDAWHEVRATLTVGADGRFSKVRSLAGIEPIKTAPPMDIVWFRLSRKPTDPEDAGAFFIGGGHLIVMLNRNDCWQLAYAVWKGQYNELRESGIEALRQSVTKLVPWLGDRVHELQDWHSVSVLAVESSRVPCWFRAGLLLIGDAAHVMSPVGGVGINYAIQDAVEAANIVGESLRTGQAPLSALAAVQRRRVPPVRFIQAFQAFLQRKIVAQALREDQPFQMPLILRIITKLPVLRSLPARIIGFGLRRVHVRQ